MTNNVDIFTPSAVLDAVAVELKFNRDDLEIAGGGPLDLVETPCNHYTVKSRSTSFCVTVHRDKSSAENLCRALVLSWLIRGEFFDQMEPSRELLDAVVNHCKLDDLRPWLTTMVRKGWVLEPLPGLANGFVTVSRSVESIKADQAKLLEEYFRDPLNAVLRLERGDLAETIAVLIEQCAFDTKVMIDAIVKSEGGWEGFSYGMVATTLDGFFIEAENEYAVEYMVQLYDSQSSSTVG